MKAINFLILLQYIDYVYLGAFYQFLPKYSFNFRNQNTSSVISSLILKGDVIKGKDSFKLTNNGSNSYGLIQTREPLNVTQFEYQLTFKLNAKHSRGSGLGIWFYTEKTNMPEGKTFFGFTNQFKGFGVLIYTMPEIKEDLTTLRIKLILNENGTILDPIDLKQLEKGSSCTEALSKRMMTITIKTKEAYLEVMFDNLNSLINRCAHAQVNYIKNKYYNIALTSFNGEYNGTLFQDQIEIRKVAMFNTFYKDARAILGLPELPVKEYDDYQLNQPLRKAEESKEIKALTLNDLNKMINKLSVDALKLKEQMKKELNITFLSQTIPLLADNINYLIELLDKTASLIISNEEHELFTNKIKILFKEYKQIVDRWLIIRPNAAIYPDLYNQIQKSLIKIHDDLMTVQNLEFYTADILDFDLSPLKIVLSNKNSSLTNAVYGIIVILVLVIGILILQIFTKTKKEKIN